MWMLFKAGKALFMRIERYIGGKQAWFCQLKPHFITHFVAFEEHMADKCLAKPS